MEIEKIKAILKSVAEFQSLVGSVEIFLFVKNCAAVISVSISGR